MSWNNWIYADRLGEEEQTTMTRNEARQYFRDKGLRYADISRTDLALLGALLDRNFAREKKRLLRDGDFPPYWERVNSAKNFRGEWTETGAMVCAMLTGKGAYFSCRDVISFNRDGYIGFCGDASDRNAQPVLEAFVEWCDELAAEKEMTTEEVSL